MDKAAAVVEVKDEALRFLASVKVTVKDRKRTEWVSALAVEKFDLSEAVGRLALANKAQKVLNRVRVAARAGRVDANDLDRQRLQTIAGEGLTDAKANLLMRNTLATAYNAGFRQQGMEDDSIAYVYYLTMRDERVREEHAKWDGLILPKDSDLAAKIYPPNGHNCRCVMQNLTAEQATQAVADGAGTMDEPPMETVSYVDKATGETVTTIKGVDPGWEGPPDDSPEAVGLLLERQLRLLANS